MNTKNKLLNILKNNYHDWVSGEKLSQKLNVSRSAICKNIHSLIDKGYTINSSTKKGYYLEKIPDRLYPEEIKYQLNTKIFGQNEILYYQEIDSTNTEAKRIASAYPEGTILIAEQQLCGRGRKGRSWHSPGYKGIYLSIILKPQISPSEASKITLMTAVAAVETLLSFSDLNYKIKWPNDILINQKKIAGILTEISTDIDSIEYIISGIGININTNSDEYPYDIKKIGTSLLIETNKKFSRISIIKKFLQIFERYYHLFIDDDFNSILKSWKQYSNIIGKNISVNMSGKIYTGEVADINNKGLLILKDKNNNYIDIISGDIKYIN